MNQKMKKKRKTRKNRRNRDIELVDLTEFAEMKRCSKSLIRLRLSEELRGVGDPIVPMPKPISTRPKQRLYWLREECVRYIERLNAVANHQPPQQCAQQLSPETMMLADRLGLDDAPPKGNVRRVKGRQK